MCQSLLPFSFFSFLFVLLEALAVCFLVVVFLETWIDEVHKSSVLTMSHILKKENLLQLIKLTDGLVRLIVFENGLFHSCLSVKAKVNFVTKELFLGSRNKWFIKTKLSLRNNIQSHKPVSHSIFTFLIFNKIAIIWQILFTNSQVFPSLTGWMFDYLPFFWLCFGSLAFPFLLLTVGADASEFYIQKC